MTTPDPLDLGTLEKAIGIGAYEIGGGDFTYGQTMNEDFVNNLVKLPFATFENMIDVLTQALLKFPIEALEAFKPLVPDWLEDDILDVATAVSKIVAALTPKEILATLTDLINFATAIFQALTGGLLPDLPFADLLPLITSAMQAIPFLNILGIGGPGDIGGSVQATWDQLVSGLVGVEGTGSSLADVFNIGQLVSSWASLGRNSWDILGIRNNNPLNLGLLPTTTSNYGLENAAFDTAANPSTGGISVSTTSSRILFKRVQQYGNIGVVSWLGSGTTNITDMRLRVWKQDTSTGDLSKVYESANIIGDVGASLSHNTHALSTPITDAVPGDVYGYEVAVVAGTGTHKMGGKTSWLPDRADMFPRRWAATRNGTTGPSTLSYASSEYTYHGDTPFIEVGVSAGNVAIPHTPEIHQFNQLTQNGSTIPIPSWANQVQVIVVGSGGGGAGGTAAYGIDGDHGDPGQWGLGTWIRGTEFTGAAVVTIGMGAPGVGGGGLSSGTAGHTCSASIPGHTITGAGGAGGSGLGTYTGPSPSPHTQTVDGVPYNGGATQNTEGGSGNAPGGGGAGGGFGFVGQNGGNGGIGSVWLRFKQ